MTKFFVKKPYFVIVSIIMVLVIGFVSLQNMRTDLLPNLELPYLAVITTEIGASPEKVQSDIVEPMESTLGTLSGVEKVSSTSNNNYGMVMLTFSDDTDMNSALVRVSKTLNSMTLPEGCSTPNILEISMDMVATLYADISYEGKSIKELSYFAENTVKPYLERQNGIASVSANGLVEDSVEIRLNQKKVDRVNDKILAETNDKLKKARSKLSSSKSKLLSGKKKLISGEKKLKAQQNKTLTKLGKASTQLSKVQATKAAHESTLMSLSAQKAALEGERDAYKKAKLSETYDAVDKSLAAMNQNLSPIASTQGITVPSSIEEAVNNPDELKKFIEWMKKAGYSEQVKSLSPDGLKKLYTAVKIRLPQIDSQLSSLELKLKIQKGIVEKFSQKTKKLDSQIAKLNSAGLTAAAGFGSGKAELGSAKSELERAEKELDSARDKLDESFKSVRENANIDALLTLDTLSKLISAQSFSMPAGYVKDKSGHQWLVEINESLKSPKQLKSLVLTKIKGVGKIRLKDVANIVTVDNLGEAYSKVNGKDNVMLSIFKASTANTSEVSKTMEKAFSDLEKKYDGLEFTKMVDQGDYIALIINSVLSSILLGAALAILVLALFLKSVKPTLVVAFSIPFSVLFALIIMYFTGINLNVMSLAGLCISIGMLVDNSVVVMENIFRMRQKGLPAPRAAVQGTKQVAGPIIASTVTTICVFLPMVYTTGMVAQLLIPFAFTISYALTASLVVALTVVPTLGSLLLKKTKPRKQNWFDKLKNVYAKILAFFLRFKVIPLVAATALLVICVMQTFSTGVVMIDDNDGNQLELTMTLDKDISQKKAYKTADEVIDKIMSVKGVDKIAGLDGNTGLMASVVGSGAVNNYTQFSFIVLTDENVTTIDEYREIRRQIEKNTKDIECESLEISSSGMSSMSSMLSSGVSVNIYGDDKEKLIKTSEDVMKLMNSVDGLSEADNGIAESDRALRLRINRNKAAEYGLTVAQIFAQIAEKATVEKNALTIKKADRDINVDIVDKRNRLTYENLLNMKITATSKNSEGQDVKKEYRLKKFAKAYDGYTMDTIKRENQRTYLAVTAKPAEDKNAALLGREVQKKLDKYKAPSGCECELAGSSVQTNDMLKQMAQAIALGFLLIYLVMVAQFQSFLSPFIVIFTVPLAFTGGMIGLGLFKMTISSMSLMGFMILMGTVVNNGIVFVDYANKLRIRGVEKRRALIETGKTRMRPILMTALTTILSMSVMVFSQDAGNAMQRSMAVVVSVGLLYSTLMTLFIIPVMYDIFYRKQPKEIDVGDDLDDEAEEAEEYFRELETKKMNNEY